MTDAWQKWNFNAPQYVDFIQLSAGLDDTNVEEYFEIDHENEPTDQDFTEITDELFNEGSNLEALMSENKEEGSKENTEYSTDVESNHFKDEEADTLASLVAERSRARIVLEANEERKRLSMSVDRGKNKFQKIGKVIPMRNLSVEQMQENLKISKEEVRAADEIISGVRASSSTCSLKKDGNTMEVDVVSAITDGISEEIRLEAACSYKQIAHKGIPMKISSNLKLTQVMPFSFEKRNQQLKTKRDNFVKKVIEAEKKAREFKAQPFPDIIYSGSAKVQLPNYKSKEMAQKCKTKNLQSFKAKTASVLKKEPFVPVKSHYNLTEPSVFQLNTETRAQKRAEFEKYLKDKEQMREVGRQLAEKRKLAEEEESIKKLREGLVHKPLPMPNFKQTGEIRKPIVDKESMPQKKK